VEPPGTRHSSHIDGDGHLAYLNCGARLNPRTDSFILADLVAPLPPAGTMLDLPLRTQPAEGQHQGRRWQKRGDLLPAPTKPRCEEGMGRRPTPRSRSRFSTLPTLASPDDTSKTYLLSRTLLLLFLL
jgi:hypothetical protein